MAKLISKTYGDALLEIAVEESKIDVFAEEAKKLEEAGAAAIMPLAAPIGSNKGLCTKDFVKIIIEETDLPVIVDAGIGKPSQACEAMEMGAAAVMANTAIATATASSTFLPVVSIKAILLLL